MCDDKTVADAEHHLQRNGISRRQFSAAVADNEGAGGLIRDITNHRLPIRYAYLLILVVTLAITWETNVNEIIAWASRAFALFYTFMGIPIARNRCLAEAKSLGASHVVFIDDKERADAQWLQAFKSLSETFETPVFIEGRVDSIMPAGSPEYMHAFFQREVRADGAAIQTCTTANVWMPLELVERFSLAFDESDPFAGGTDTKLFTHARAQGAALHYAAKAVVYEELPLERFNWQWLAQRRFRCGVTDGELQAFETGLARAQYQLKRLVGVLSNGVKALLFKAFSRQKALKYTLKTYRKAGELMGARGHRVQSYKSVDGA